MYGRGRRCTSAKVGGPTPRAEQIAAIERRIAEYQGKLAVCSAEYVPSYERRIANERAMLQVTREAA